MKHRGTIIISNGGKIRATTEGVDGPSCKGLLDWMESMGEVKEHRPTSDMNKRKKSKVRQKVSSS